MNDMIVTPNVKSNSFDERIIALQMEQTNLLHEMNRRVSAMDYSLEEMKTEQKKSKEEYRVIKEDVTGLQRNMNELDVLGHPVHDPQMAELAKVVAARCYELFGAKDSDSYKLWRYRIYGWCYAYAARAANVTSRKNIPMEDYWKDDSYYQRALTAARKWCPNWIMYNEAFMSMQEDYRKGRLAQDRANAFSRWEVSEERFLLERIIKSKG